MKIKEIFTLIGVTTAVWIIWNLIDYIQFGYVTDSSVADTIAALIIVGVIMKRLFGDGHED